MAARAGSADASLGPLDVLAHSPSSSAVVTDFDGTLSLIVENPEEAVAIEAVPQVLARLARSFGVVAVVSGRPVEFLRRRLEAAGPDVRLVGIYGLQWLEDGRVVTAPGADEWVSRVSDVVTQARAEAPTGVGVEDKGVSVTIHWRRAPDAGDWAHDFAARWAERTGLAAHSSRMALDFRPPLAVDKGTALTSLVAGCKAACFAGDDMGDLAAFAALDQLAQDGMTAVRIAVADAESPPALSDAADLVVAGPIEAVGLFERLAIAAEAAIDGSAR